MDYPAPSKAKPVPCRAGEVPPLTYGGQGVTAMDATIKLYRDVPFRQPLVHCCQYGKGF
jgi:hypothetical protein